jgi:prepilin-type N-terminal cleavage/methylation domain-containing protein
MKSDNKAGFTLIELMVVVAIIAILAAIAIPIYINYVYRSKQVEAKTLLTTIKLEEEQFRAENNCYTLLVTDLPDTNNLYQNNRYYKTAPTFTGTSTADCPAPNRAADFQAAVQGTLASGHAVDWWATSDVISGPVHCDARTTYTADQTAACTKTGASTTEMEY